MKSNAFFQWLNSNLGILLLALLLSMIVWIAAVFSADPNEECSSPAEIPLELRNQDPSNLIFGEVPDAISVRLFAPRSLCIQMAEDVNSIEMYVDMAALTPGSYDDLPVLYEIAPQYSPVRLLGMSPQTVSFKLEAFATRILPLVLEVSGEPAPGYTVGPVILSESRVEISGTREIVDQVAMAIVRLDISDVDEEVNTSRAVQLLDADDRSVSGLELAPRSVNIRQIIERPGSFREVIVRVIYEGAPADGYRLTNISPTPQTLTVFSNDPQLIRLLPGFIETEPIDLTGATDDIEVRRRVVLPEGVFVDGEQNVLVQVGIAAIESSLNLNVPIEPIGLSSGLGVVLEPETADVLLSGPLPILTGLQPLDVRVVLDMAGYETGEYLIAPRVEIIPLGITVDSILPGMIEVNIIELPTPTPGENETPIPTTPPSP